MTLHRKDNVIEVDFTARRPKQEVDPGVSLESEASIIPYINNRSPSFNVTGHTPEELLVLAIFGTPKTKKTIAKHLDNELLI